MDIELLDIELSEMIKKKGIQKTILFIGNKDIDIKQKNIIVQNIIKHAVKILNYDCITDYALLSFMMRVCINDGKLNFKRSHKCLMNIDNEIKKKFNIPVNN